MCVAAVRVKARVVPHEPNTTQEPLMKLKIVRGLVFFFRFSERTLVRRSRPKSPEKIRGRVSLKLGQVRGSSREMKIGIRRPKNE